MIKVIICNYNMKITCFANYCDPQTVQLFTTLYERSNHQFKLAATERFPEELIKYGYSDLNEMDFVEKLYEEEDPIKRALMMAEEADILMYGHCPVDYFNLSVRSGKPVFRLSQHIYRDGNLKAVPVKWKISYFVKHTIALLGKPVYLMCLGRYTARDFSLTGSYKNKMYEFGEFTPYFEYDQDSLMNEKKSENTRICWINTFHDWHHPEIIVEVLDSTKDKMYEMTVGCFNETESWFKQKLSEYKNVKLIEDIKIDQVDRVLKDSSIFLMTSDHNEGWGNILNQAMNHGCACVVSNAVGSSKMIEHRVNGLLYVHGDSNDLITKLKYLLDNPQICEFQGRNAYQSIVEKWNGCIAGERFYELVSNLLKGKDTPFDEGLCSRAKIIMEERADSICLANNK